MDHQFRRSFLKNAQQSIKVADVAISRIDFAAQAIVKHLEKARGFRRQGITRHLRARVGQNLAKPRTFKARMPGQENPAVSEKLHAENVYHTFHGALPSCQRRSKKLLSR